MTDTKHTPGPWHANGPLITASNDMALRVASAYGTDIGNAPMNADQAAANIRLIAAAPDLLAALKDLLGDRTDVQRHDCIHCGRTYDDEPDFINCPADDCPGHNARAAIAKAEGR